MAAGTFREDLYYRLNVVPLYLPPLRTHKEDIPFLVNHILQKLGVKLNRGKLSMTPAAVAKLQAHDWPGNVRELEHLLERMVALCPNDEFTERDVPEVASPGDSGELVSVRLENQESIDMAAVIQQTETRMLRWALSRAQGNLAQAAEMLGIPRSTLQYKVSKLEEADGKPADAQ